MFMRDEKDPACLTVEAARGVRRAREMVLCPKCMHHLVVYFRSSPEYEAQVRAKASLNAQYDAMVHMARGSKMGFLGCRQIPGLFGVAAERPPRLRLEDRAGSGVPFGGGGDAGGGARGGGGGRPALVASAGGRNSTSASAAALSDLERLGQLVVAKAARDRADGMSVAEGSLKSLLGGFVGAVKTPATRRDKLQLYR